MEMHGPLTREKFIVTSSGAGEPPSKEIGSVLKLPGSSSKLADDLEAAAKVPEASRRFLMSLECQGRLGGERDI